MYRAKVARHPKPERSLRAQGTTGVVWEERHGRDSTDDARYCHADYKGACILLQFPPVKAGQVIPETLHLIHAKLVPNLSLDHGWIRLGLKCALEQSSNVARFCCDAAGCKR